MFGGGDCRVLHSPLVPLLIGGRRVPVLPDAGVYLVDHAPPVEYRFIGHRVSVRSHSVCGCAMVVDLAVVVMILTFRL